MADRTRGGVRSFLLLFAGSLLAGVVVGYIAGGGSRGRAPEAARSDRGPVFAEETPGGAAPDQDAGDNPFAGFRVGAFELVDYLHKVKGDDQAIMVRLKERMIRSMGSTGARRCPQPGPLPPLCSRLRRPRAGWVQRDG